MPFFQRENIEFYYEEYGAGPAFVFSHGLGGNLTHMRELIGDLPGIRLILYDSRAHGRTAPMGDPTRLTFPVMAEDMAALLDVLEIPSAVIGGVSMGAAISTAFTLKHRPRVKALLLSRPAWLNSPSPPNLSVLQEIADLVEQFGGEAGAERFKKTVRFATLERIAPETAKSMITSFTDRDPAAIISTFRYIPASVPFDSWEALGAIDMPALILANQNDPLHPYEFGEQLLAALPRASMCEFPARSASPELHQSRFRELLKDFVYTHA